LFALIFNMSIFQKTIARLHTFFRYRELFFQLVSRAIKLKYRRSILGYIWSVLNPLLIMVVMAIVFSTFFSQGIQYFPIYLLIGHILFSFMTGATTMALVSVIENASLLKKVYVPKYIFTLATVTSELVIFIFTLGALIVVILVSGTPLTVRFFLNIIPITEQYVFCLGLGLFLAQAAVFFRDIIHIWGVVTTAWLYLTAIFYPVTVLPENIRFIVTHYNPLYFYIAMFRNFTIGGPNMGSLDFAIRGAVAAVLMLFVGLISFSHNKNKFILYM